MKQTGGAPAAPANNGNGMQSAIMQVAMNASNDYVSNGGGAIKANKNSSLSL